MPLWGKTNTTTAKPKYLNHIDAGNTYADSRGWVLAVKNPDGTTKSEEVLVAISELSDDVGVATPTAIYFDADAYENGDVATLTIEWDEEIQFSGATVIAANLTVTGVTLGGAAKTFAYSSGVGADLESNKINFQFTLDAVGALVIGGCTVNLLNSLVAKDNTDSTKVPDLETTTAENKGAGGSGAYANVTVAA